MQKILVCSEFSQLHTGYAVYCKELLTRLSKHHLVFEIANYCDPIDHQALIQQTPWKVYPVCPNKNNPEEVKIYESDPNNVFGKWKFESVVNDCRPNIVIIISDWWMGNFINESPLRKYFNFVWMVTCDGYPQNEEWIANYRLCDGRTAYTEWGKKILEEHGLNVFGVTSPGKNDIFKPLNKQTIKTNFGLVDKTIIGTVMRNQKRKLFPDLFQAFRQYLNESQDHNTFLYCHTSYPDMGWDIPKLLLEHQLTSKVLFTYKCKNCKLFFPSHYYDIVAQCPRCKELSAQLTNVSNGITSEELCIIYNLFDLYIQPNSCEGFGIPCCEAALCNIPIAATDYSATSDLVQKLNGYPIKVAKLSLEQETGRYMANIDVQSIVDILHEFCNLPKTLQLKRGYETGKLCHEHYNWNKTEQIWKDYIDKVDSSNNLWNEPIRLINPNFNAPQNLSNSQFVKWAITNILQDTSKLNTYFETKLLRQLNVGIVSSNFLAGFTDDLSMFGRPKIQPFTRDNLVAYLLHMVEKHNFWEKARIHANFTHKSQ